jgi:predicted ATPase
VLNSRYLVWLGLKEEPPRESWLWGLPAVKSLSQGERLELDAPVTFLTGENGSGKSTLLEAAAVCCGFNPEGGTINFCFSTRDTHSELWRYLRVARGTRRPRDGFFLRAESFYNVATNIDDMDEGPSFSPPVIQSYGGVSLHRRSHGESFLALAENRFGGQGLYLLDEPEAALSPGGLMRLLVRIRQLEMSGSQFVIATHSPILMTYPGASLYLLDEKGFRPVSYQETEHYQLTRRFLENPEGMYRQLFG